jgi:hypothetical protein
MRKRQYRRRNRRINMKKKNSRRERNVEMEEGNKTIVKKGKETVKADG